MRIFFLFRFVFVFIFVCFFTSLYSFFFFFFFFKINRSPNVFLDSKNGFEKGVVAKVADFGMAGVNYYRMGKFLKTWQVSIFF